MLNWLQSHQDFAIKDALFCMEHTGIYNYPLLQFINHHSAMVWVENPIQIKKSMGLQRGKNDKVDSIRIAQYAYQAKEKVKLWQPARKVVDRLKYLTNLRERLVETKKRLQTPVEELMKIGNKDMANLLKKSMSKTIKGFGKGSAKY